MTTPQRAPAVVATEAAGRFELDEAGGRWTFAGELTFGNAAEVCAAACGLPLPATGVVDCAGIRAADSAAVAVLVQLQRRAATEGRTLAFANLPASLATLGALYGVDGILRGLPQPG